MKHRPKTTTVPALVGKNPTEIAKSYLNWIGDPGSKCKLDLFGLELDRYVRQLLPDNTLSGCIRGKEPDVRQDTMKELLRGFLTGSTDLRAAVRTGNLPRIAEAMRRCIRTCLKNNRLRTLEIESAHKGGVPEISPCMETQSSDYETEHNMRMRVRQLLSSTVASKELSKEEAKLLRRLVVEESTREQTAAEMKRSMSWISKRLAKIKRKLRTSKDMRRVLEADM